MITNNEKWHYIAAKNLSRLLQGITSNYNGDYYCFNYLYSFRTKIKLILHENVCNDHNCSHIIIPEKGKNILKYNQNKISLKIQFVIHAYLAYHCLKKLTRVESSRTKISKHTVYVFIIHTLFIR